MSEHAPELRLSEEQAQRMLAEFDAAGAFSLHPKFAGEDAVTAHAILRERDAAEARVQELDHLMDGCAKITANALKNVESAERELAAERELRLAAEARADKAEYELSRWKDATTSRPDWEKLWEEQSNRADAAEAHRDQLRAIIKSRVVGVYGPMCRDSSLCIPKGYCPRDPTCAD